MFNLIVPTLLSHTEVHRARKEECGADTNPSYLIITTTVHCRVCRRSYESSTFSSLWISSERLVAYRKMRCFTRQAEARRAERGLVLR
jgi:hypothetical protein